MLKGNSRYLCSSLSLGSGPPWRSSLYDIPSLLKTSLGDSVALTQGSFLSILRYCPTGTTVTRTYGTHTNSATSSTRLRVLLHHAEHSPPSAPLCQGLMCLGTNSSSKVSLGNFQRQFNKRLGSVCYL